MNDLWAIAAVLGALGMLMAAVAAMRWPAELSRKAVHAGMGTICLTFPWVFSDARPVMVLAALAVLGLGAVRVIPAVRERLGAVLGGVGRRSWGEFYFPIAVAIVFQLSTGDPLLYVIPVLTLTVADSVGALVGVRYGFSQYAAGDGHKSTEGSVAFFTAAFLTCHVPLLLFSSVGRTETLLISLTAGLVVMLLEAISWRGQDNLVIPLGMFLILRLYLPLDAAALWNRLLVLAALVGLVLLLRRRTTLDGGAVLAAALSGFAIWAFGGWLWLAGPLALFWVYIFLPAFPHDARPAQNLHAVTRVMAGGFFWLFLSVATDRETFLAPFLLCMAAHTGNIITARLRVVRPGIPLSARLAVGWLVPSALFAALALAAAGLGELPVMVAALVPGSVAVSVAWFVPAWSPAVPPSQPRRWFAETMIAVLASLPGLLIAFPP